MEASTTEPTRQKALRLPASLLDEITELANGNQRSAEAEIRVALQEHVARAKRRRKRTR